MCVLLDWILTISPENQLIFNKDILSFFSMKFDIASYKYVQRVIIWVDPSLGLTATLLHAITRKKNILRKIQKE